MARATKMVSRKREGKKRKEQRRSESPPVELHDADEDFLELRVGECVHKRVHG